MENNKEKLRGLIAGGRKENKARFREGFGKYGLIIFAVLIVMLVTSKAAVPYDNFTVKDVSSVDTNAARGWFVAGTMNEGHRFAGSTTDFDPETGICRITLKEYRFFGIIGGNDFVVYVQCNPEEVKEIVYVLPSEDPNVPEQLTTLKTINN